MPALHSKDDSVPGADVRTQMLATDEEETYYSAREALSPQKPVRKEVSLSIKRLHLNSIYL